MATQESFKGRSHSLPHPICFFAKKHIGKKELVLRAQMDFINKPDIWEYLLCPKFRFLEFPSIQTHLFWQWSSKSETRWHEPEIRNPIALESHLTNLKTCVSLHAELVVEVVVDGFMMYFWIEPIVFECVCMISVTKNEGVDQLCRALG